jgi:hypothetical protein
MLLQLLLLLLNVSRSLFKSVSSNACGEVRKKHRLSSTESGETEYADCTVTRQTFTLTFQIILNANVYDLEAPTTKNHYHNNLDVFWLVNCRPIDVQV